MRRFYVIALFTVAAWLLAPLARCQSDSMIHVNQFHGTTVGDKVTAAMAHCPDAPIPCYLILDGSLAAAAQGTLPTLCGSCHLVDFRTGWPGGIGGTLLPACLSNSPYASQYSGADAGLKIQAAIAAACNYGTVFVDFSGTQTWSVNPLAGITNQVALVFRGCSTITLDAGITLTGAASGQPAGQEIKGAGRGCTIFQDGANGITLISLGGGTRVTDVSINYNGHTGVAPVSMASNSLLRNVTINGGFPGTAIARNGAPGTGVYSAHTVDVAVNGTGSAPQYGVAEISTPVGYVGLNEDDNLTVQGTSVAAYYLDGGDSGGPTTCHNCNLAGNTGIGLHVVNANAKVDGDCEGNSGGNVVLEPIPLTASPQNFNTPSDIHCASASEVFITTRATGTIANSSNTMTVSGVTEPIQAGMTLWVTGATFNNSTGVGQGVNTSFDPVASVSGSTITFRDSTTVSGGVSGAYVWGPVTPQFLQNDGTPTFSSSEFFTEYELFEESPFIRRPVIEGITNIDPELNNPTLTRWKCDSGLVDWEIVDSSYAAFVDFNCTNHTLTVGGGSNVVYRCTTAGTLPVGALTTVTANCGSVQDTDLRTP